MGLFPYDGRFSYLLYGMDFVPYSERSGQWRTYRSLYHHPVWYRHTCRLDLSYNKYSSSGDGIPYLGKGIRSEDYLCDSSHLSFL